MKRLFKIAAAGAAIMANAAQAADHQYNLEPPVTMVARQIYDLHSYVLIVCLLIFVFVFGWMFIAIFKHRKSLNHKPAQFHENTTVEIVWTIVPFLIVVALAVPATKTVLAMKDTTNSELTVKATGYQWRWGYEYLRGDGEGISFMSSLTTPREQIEGADPAARAANPAYLREVDNPLVVPVDTKVRVITTANDVIHAWTVPAFGVKQDAIPGFVRDIWFKAEKVGTYRGQCVELCGKEHAFMPIVVKVVSKDEYKTWVQARQAPQQAEDPNKTWELADLSARGEKVFAQNCAACHQLTGKGVPGAFPALDGSKVVLGQSPVQINVLLNGVVRDGKQTAMVSWKHLSDVEIASVITYTKNAWSNRLGVAVQPREIAAMRNGGQVAAR